MLDNFKFANINAKVKGMYSKFLNQEDYEELSKQGSVKEFIILLKSKIKNIDNIDDNSTRQEIEKELHKILEYDIRKIEPLLNKKSKEMLEEYLKKIEDNSKEYYKKIFKKAQNYKDKNLIDIIGKQIDLNNLLWTYRSKKYHKENYEIDLHYKLSKEMLDRINAGQEPADDLILKTIYNELTMQEDTFEYEIEQYLYKLYINYFKTQPFSITMIIAYLELQQIQIKNIIIILEGIRYKLDSKIIQKKLIGKWEE